MLSRWPILFKLLVVAGALCIILAMLSFSSFQGVYAYRQFVRNVSYRASELPRAAELAKSVSELRLTASRIRQSHGLPMGVKSVSDADRQHFSLQLFNVHLALNRYREQLESDGPSGPLIDGERVETRTVAKIEEGLQKIDELVHAEDWVLDELQTMGLRDELDSIDDLCKDLPSHLHQRLQAFAGEVRGQYRAWIVITWVTTVLAAVLLLILGVFFSIWIYSPLHGLIQDSRRISAGNFDHRIQVRTRDEVAELASAMNDMTDRFRAIRDHLDQKVKERTRELEARTQQLVRSEQLASVGFLAAGVAHEINNPLASIAWCAESLETRVKDILIADEKQAESERDPEIGVLRKYLQRIQSEAFRCKGITEKLLDFSRLGRVDKHDTDLAELIDGVIEMVRTIGNYRGKRIEFTQREPVVARVNAQEIKQVVLNLLTNALDSLDANGAVTVRLSRKDGEAELIVSDNGCGMTDDVLQNLFQPFFTRRRDGQGTGLGLCITHRIVDEHEGTIRASSEGPGRGSRMTVTLPLVPRESRHEKRYNKVA